jgi:hypothetical protein
MFVSDTVFVLGARASHEVGLPVGSQLAEIISKKMDIRYEKAFPSRKRGGDIGRFPRRINIWPSRCSALHALRLPSAGLGLAAKGPPAPSKETVKVSGRL